MGWVCSTFWYFPSITKFLGCPLKDSAKAKKYGSNDGRLRGEVLPNTVEKDGDAASKTYDAT